VLKYIKKVLDKHGISNVYRVREKKNCYGISFKFNRKTKFLGFKIPALSSISLHTGKTSVYAFLPFWSMKSSLTTKELCKLHNLFMGQTLRCLLHIRRFMSDLG